jgi:hypothetical protein
MVSIIAEVSERKHFHEMSMLKQNVHELLLLVNRRIPSRNRLIVVGRGKVRNYKYIPIPPLNKTLAFAFDSLILCYGEGS